MFTTIRAAVSGATSLSRRFRPFLLTLLLVLCNAAVAAEWAFLGGTRSVKYRVQNGIHVVSVNLKDPDIEIRPVLTGSHPAGETTSALARRQGAIAAVNGGFFSFSDRSSLSFVKVDGRVLARPEDNASLWDPRNANQYAYRRQILGRSELRVFATAGGGYGYEIATPWVQPIAPSSAGGRDFAVSPQDSNARARALHVLQGGPRLLPGVGNMEEGFTYVAPDPRSGKTLEYSRPGVNATGRAPRTAVCFTATGFMALIVLDRSRPMTNRELSAWIAGNLPGCGQALAMDSGGSSTLYLKDRGGAVAIGEQDGSERRVSSALLVLAKAELPRVQGMALGEAQRLLAQRGFQGTVDRYVAPRSARDSGRVAAQSLEPGRKYPAGTVVRLIVFAAAPPATPTRPPGCAARPSLTEGGYLTDQERQCVAWREWMKRNRPEDYRRILMTE